MKKIVGLLLVVLLLAFAGSAFAADANKSKMLRFSMANTPKLDPAVGADTSSAITFSNIYDTLVFPDLDGAIIPHLALNWDISPDGLTYTFHLRNDAKFHSGNPLTAEDVVFSMERLLTIQKGYAYLYSSAVKSVSAPDQYTVEFKLNKVFGPFLSSLIHFSIVDKKLIMENLQPGDYGDMKDYGTNYLLANDAGSGPYMVKELVVNQHLIADKFDDYWAGFKPNNPDGFKLIGTTEPVTIRTLMSRKELEITDEYQPMENYEALAKMDGIEIANFPSGKVMMVQINTSKAPVDDVHFRRMLAYVIDYQALCDLTNSNVARGPISSELPGSDTSIAPLSLNLEKAKEELALSKYAKELDKYPLDIIWTAETPDREKIALAIQANASEVGIKANVVKVPWLTLVSMNTQQDTAPPAVIMPLLPDYPEAGAVLSAGFHSSSLRTTRNIGWQINPTVDRLIDEAMSTLETEDRFEKYKSAQVQIMNDMPVIPIFGVGERHAYQSSYITWAQAELVKEGKPLAPNQCYNIYMRNIEFK